MNNNLDDALDKLLTDQSPRAQALELDDEEREMLRMAQLIRGSQAVKPRAEFVETLHDRFLPPTRRVSRRTAFLSGVGALAAGLLAGVGVDRAVAPGASVALPLPRWLTPKKGEWTRVADVAEVPQGAVKPFTAGPVQGVLVHDAAGLRAMSRVCTHMACSLNYAAAESALVCPCHGAEFDLQGRLRYGVHGYNYHLPPLPRIHVRTSNGGIEVLTAGNQSSTSGNSVPGAGDW